MCKTCGFQTLLGHPESTAAESGPPLHPQIELFFTQNMTTILIQLVHTVENVPKDRWVV